jgi:hypothetical protein
MNAIESARIARELGELVSTNPRELLYQTDMRGLVWMYPNVLAGKFTGSRQGPGVSLLVDRGFAWCLKVGQFLYLPATDKRAAVIRAINVSQFRGPIAELQSRIEGYQFLPEQEYIRPHLNSVLRKLK